MVEECQVIVDKPAAKKSHDHIGESYKVFSNLESGLQAVASNFELKYGDGNGRKIVWKILAEKEQKTVCPMEDERASTKGMNPSDESPFLDDIPWD